MTCKREYCQGCRQNFYNGNNEMGIKKCCHFKTGKVVKRYRIGWWTPQDKAENFHKVTTNSCHCATGKYADYEQLPYHLRQGRKP